MPNGQGRLASLGLHQLDVPAVGVSDEIEPARSDARVETNWGKPADIIQVRRFSRWSVSGVHRMVDRCLVIRTIVWLARSSDRVGGSLDARPSIAEIAQSGASTVARS